MKALMWPTEPRTTMSTPFIEMPQRAEASPLITTRPPRPVAPADWLALPSTTTVPDMMFSARPDARVAVHAHASPACSCRRSSSPRGPRSRPRAARRSPPPPRARRAGSARASGRSSARRVQRRVELTQRGHRQVDLVDRRPRSPTAVTRPARAPSCRRGPARAPTCAPSSAPGSIAIARYSEAIATQSSVSAITAGLQAIGSRSTAKPSTVPTANV